MTFHINYAKKGPLSMFTLFQNKKFESLDSRPSSSTPRHLGYQFNTDDLATTAGSTKTNGAHLGTPQGSWVEIIIDSKKRWDFFWDGGYVSFGGG